MKPSPVSFARLRFSTKDVGKGFYRGNRTGSLGAHTAKGGYVIDYRKVRNYNVPNLTDFQLTPFVSREVGEKEMPAELTERDEDKNFAQLFKDTDLSVTRRKRAMEFLEEWKQSNPQEFEAYEKYQIRESLDPDLDQAQGGESVNILERLKFSLQASRRNNERYSP